jgi:hypothetical protein
MTAATATVLITLLTALQSSAASGAAAQHKYMPSGRGGHGAYTTPRSPAKGSHQWSADPERGWVRDDDDGADARRSPSERNHQSKGHSQGKKKSY